MARNLLNFEQGFAVKLMESVINARFCLFKMTWKTTDVGMEYSDLAICCDSTLFDVEGIFLVFCRRVLY